MLRRWFDGRVKMFVTWKGLDLRKRKAEVFRRGAYTALQSDSESAVAFLRGDELLVAAPVSPHA